MTGVEPPRRPVTVAFTSHGARIEIRADAAVPLRRIRDRLPPGSCPLQGEPADERYAILLDHWAAADGVTRLHVLVHESRWLAKGEDLDALLDVLEADLHFRVALRARTGLFVHAGVVGWRGRAIVIPGRSGSGKTTLVRALVRAGATYYSDEFAVLDDRGLVHPYARPPFVRAAPLERPRRSSIADLGGACGTEPLRPGLVVVTEYRADASWRPRALSPGETVLALFRNTVLARLRPHDCLHTLSLVARAARAVMSPRGDLASAVGSVLGCVDGIGLPAPEGSTRS